MVLLSWQGGESMTKRYVVTVALLRALGGFRLPGEVSCYALPGKRVPEGCLEVFGIVHPFGRRPYLHYRLGRASPAALRLARQWRASQVESDGVE